MGYLWRPDRTRLVGAPGLRPLPFQPEQLPARVDSKLAVDVLDVDARRADADAQRGCDLSVRPTLSEQLEHVPLATRKCTDPLGARRSRGIVAEAGRETHGRTVHIENHDLCLTPSDH